MAFDEHASISSNQLFISSIYRACLSALKLSLCKKIQFYIYIYIYRPSDVLKSSSVLKSILFLYKVQLEGFQ